MEAVQVLEAPERMAYIEHEVSCPFCEESMLGVEVDEYSVFYRCGHCLNEWTVYLASALLRD